MTHSFPTRRSSDLEAQRERYLPGMARGEIRGALCLTEPGAGSDLLSIATVAREAGGQFTVAGSKFFVTNGARASLLLTLVKTDPAARSEEHTSELQSLMRISYAVFCLKKKK